MLDLDKKLREPLQPLVSLLADLQPFEETFAYEGQDYVLTEASNDATVKWRNFIMSATKINKDGDVTSVNDLADSEPYLVSMCLYRVVKGERKPLTSLDVRAMNGRFVKILHDRIMLVSELQESLSLEDRVAKARKDLADLEKKLEASKGKKDKADGLPQEESLKNG